MENPTTNATTPGDPPYLWIGQPKQRTTFGILSVCFTTTIICVWSTIHLNIPSRRHSPTCRFFLQFGWMVVALFAPEVLLYLAINEWINATALVKRTLAFHPHLAKPGMLARVYNYIRELNRVYNYTRAWLKDVSVPYQASVRSSSSSLD